LLMARFSPGRWEWTTGAMPNGRFEADAQTELAYSTVKGAVVPEVLSPFGRAA